MGNIYMSHGGTWRKKKKVKILNASNIIGIFIVVVILLYAN